MGLTHLTSGDRLSFMRKISNLLKRKLGLKIRALKFGRKQTWGEEQLGKLSRLNQGLISMEMVR